MCKDLESNNIIGTREKVLDRWAQHFEKLLNPANKNTTLDNRHHAEENKPSLEDIKEVIQRLKNHKATGLDGIPSELLKYSSNMISTILCEIIGEIWETNTIPTEWQRGVICLIHKKGDP